MSSGRQRPPTARRRNRLTRAVTAALPVVRHGDVAIVYAAIVTIIAITVSLLPSRARVGLLQGSSTNLANLHLHPVRVLVGSAFVLPGPADLWQVPVLLVGYAYAQRAVGRLATVFVAVIGHVGATLTVATMLAAGIAHGTLARSLAHASDVGVSYGLACILAFLTAFLPRGARLWYSVGLLAVFAVPTVAGVTFTDVGHGVALALGFGLALVASRVARHDVPHRP